MNGTDPTGEFWEVLAVLGIVGAVVGYQQTGTAKGALYGAAIGVAAGAASVAAPLLASGPEAAAAAGGMAVQVTQVAYHGYASYGSAGRGDYVGAAAHAISMIDSAYGFSQNFAGASTAMRISGGASQGNAAGADASSPTWPTDDRTITAPYGEDRGGQPHTGVDIRAPKGANIYSTDEGKVIDVYSNDRGGNQIRVLNKDGSVSGFAHTGPTVEVGDQVNRGQLIGHSDGSGFYRGNPVTPHLHFTYRECLACAKSDPLLYLNR